MIIQEHISIKVGPSNVKYWTSRGYEIPSVGGRGNKNGFHLLQVKVLDLHPGSNERVQCKCDQCQNYFLNRFCRNTDTCGKCRTKTKMKGNNYGTNNRNKYPTPSFEELTKKHFEEKMSLEDIRSHYGVTRPVVSRWFKEHGIVPNNHLKRLEIPSKETLIEMHIHQKMKLGEIVEHFKSSHVLVKKWMKEYGIEINNYPRERRVYPDRAILENLHLVERKTLKEISVLYGVSDVLVGIWFKELGISVNYYFSGTSKPEVEIRDHLNSLGCDFVKTRKVLSNNKELDMYSETHKLAIEYCGLYWHQETRVGKRYHLDKLNECNKKGIDLITIFEDEWLNKPDIVLSVIKSKLGLSTRIYARKCKVINIEKYKARSFLENNHIQGSANSITHSYGLFNDEELVAVMTFGKHHRGRDVLVLNRMCFLKNHTVIGGASKLFKYACNEISQPIISWSDRRWSNGDVYLKLGFELERRLEPDYSYTKGQQRFSKQSRKKNIIGCPKEIKEFDFNRELGFEPIWDCGKDAWIFKPISTFEQTS